VGQGGWLPPVPPDATPGYGPPPPGYGPPPPGGWHAPPVDEDDNNVALVSFWVGASGAFILYISQGFGAPLSLILGVISLICGLRARRRIKSGETQKHSMWAEVGLALGGVVSALSVIVGAIVAVVELA
jgi:hypothetical protein